MNANVQAKPIFSVDEILSGRMSRFVTDGLITEIEKAPTVVATHEAKEEAKTILDFMARKGVVSEAWVTAARAYIAIFAGQHIDAINARRRSLTQPKISLVG
jgi:hypothetical protein